MIASLLDEYTREVLCVAVRPKMNVKDVLDVLYLLLMKHGKPEFNAVQVQDWLRRIGIQPLKSTQGHPGRTVTTSASMEHFVEKCPTPIGSKIRNKPSLPLQSGSDNTTKFGHIMR